MVRRFMAALLLLGLCLVSGCSDDDPNTRAHAGDATTTRPINNNAPEARTAPAAPMNPGMILPSQAIKKLQSQQGAAGGGPRRP